MMRWWTLTVLSLVAGFGLACQDTPEPFAPDAGSLSPSFSISPTPTTLYYGDFALDGTQKWLPGVWDMTAGPVTLRYTADISHAPNVAYNEDYSLQAVAGLYSSLGSGARMVAFNYDWSLTPDQFPTYPDADGTLDLDDKIHLQRFPDPGSWGELMYDVLCGPNEVVAPAIGSYDNYGIWFDRDGVDPWQANSWGAVDGGTYNTLGTYDTQILFRKASSGLQGGTACPTIEPDLPNNDAPDGGVPTGFGSWPNYPDFPAGISFAASDIEMSRMSVKLEGNPGPGAIAINGVTVTGYLVLESGTATGGGWFIPEDGTVGLVNLGSKATFGFNAKQKNGNSTGHLEFQYHGDGLTLTSESYDWVTLSASQGDVRGNRDRQRRGWVEVPGPRRGRRQAGHGHRPFRDPDLDGD